MKIGYARVSTDEQNLQLQIDALKGAGCEKIYADEGVSATASRRPELEAAVSALREGDIFIIWRFDRAFRSLSHALTFLEELEGRGAEFMSLTEQLDTSTAHGRLVYHITNAMTEFERGLISERTKAGMKASAAQGQRMGRPPALTSMQVDYAKDRIEKGESKAAVARSLGVSRQTLWEYLKE